MTTGNVFDDLTTRDIIAIVREWRTGTLAAGAANSGSQQFMFQPVLPFVSNDSGEAIPPYGCMQIVGTIEIGDRNYLKVKKPVDTDGTAGAFIFNGHREIAIGQEGLAQIGPVVRGFKDTGTVTGGDKWVPVAGQWYIEQDDAGQFICCGADSVLTNVLKVINTGNGGGVATARLFKSGGVAIPAISGTAISWGMCTQQKIVSDVLTADTDSQKVYNPWLVEIPALYYFMATKERGSNQWIALFPGLLNVRWNSPNLEQSMDFTSYTNVDTAESC